MLTNSVWFRFEKDSGGSNYVESDSHHNVNAKENDTHGPLHCQQNKTFFPILRQSLPKAPAPIESGKGL